MPTSLEDVAELNFFTLMKIGVFVIAVGLCPAHQPSPHTLTCADLSAKAGPRQVGAWFGICEREISRWHAWASQDLDLSRSSDWMSVTTSDIPALRPTRMSAPGHPTPFKKFWLWRGLEVFLDRKRWVFDKCLNILFRKHVDGVLFDSEVAQIFFRVSLAFNFYTSGLTRQH